MTSVRTYWRTNSKAADFEPWWRKSVHDGLIADSALPAVIPALTRFSLPAGPAPAEGIEVVFRPDPYL